MQHSDSWVCIVRVIWGNQRNTPTEEELPVPHKEGIATLVLAFWSTPSEVLEWEFCLFAQVVLFWRKRKTLIFPFNVTPSFKTTCSYIFASEVQDKLICSPSQFWLLHRRRLHVQAQRCKGLQVIHAGSGVHFNCRLAIKHHGDLDLKLENYFIKMQKYRNRHSAFLWFSMGFPHFLWGLWALVMTSKPLFTYVLILWEKGFKEHNTA